MTTKLELNPTTGMLDLINAAIPDGTANQILGMNNAANAQEYKTLTAGTNITITHAANSVTIDSTAGGLAIGDPVGSGNIESILFVDSSTNLAQSTTFVRDESTGFIGIGMSAPVAGISIYQNLGSPQQPSSSTNAESATPGNYTPGDTTTYRIWAYKTLLGIKYFSPIYDQTIAVTLSGAGSAFDISWSDNTSGGSDGFLIIRDLNSDGFASYYDAGAVTSLFDDFDFSLTWETGTPITSPNEIGTTHYNYSDGTNFFGAYGGAGYFTKLGIGTSAPTHKLDVIENTVGTIAAIFQGYSDGGSVTYAPIRVDNELGKRIILMGGANGGAGDYGNMNFLSVDTMTYPTYNGYSHGDFNWCSGALGGDKRVGTMRVYMDGALNQGTFQLLTRNASGFQYAIVSTHDNKTGLSGISAPSAKLHLPAGSATAGTAPIKLTTGAYNTTPVAGQIEWHSATAENLTFSPSTTRYRIPLVDSGVGGLTSGRVPFATTNGRLTDDADFTFATDTLTVTKIAATTFTGNVTLSTKDIVTDTTTGTKFGTATTQKFGFYNATPVVQQTDGANLTNNVTSGGTTDIIANYTDLTTYANDAAAIRNDIYQLARKVKIIGDALRTYGLLS